MARPGRSAGGNSRHIPDPYSIGNNVFPVVPFRTQFGDIAALQAVGSQIPSAIDTTLLTQNAGNVGQEVELDLDFESNEVFDVMIVQVEIEAQVALAFATGEKVLRYCLALTDDPDKANTTQIATEAIFEGDESFVWYTNGLLQSLNEAALTEAINPIQRTEYRFVQPWTVARNLKWIYSSFSPAAGDFFSMVRIQLWGRRRNASDTEFKSIIYRQRF